MKKIIWYRGFEYKHPRKKGDQALIFKPIVVYKLIKKKVNP